MSSPADAGPLVVSMRPLGAADVTRATEITARFPLAHGAPIHSGTLAKVGIGDLSSPDYVRRAVSDG